jgi:uncharacterized protein (DUF433 family)
MSDEDSWEPQVVTVVPHPHIRIESSVLDGKSYILGSRIPVARVYAYYLCGASVEDIIKRYPQIGPAKILDALSYAFDNHDLVSSEMEKPVTR